tara:strand:+ start:13 stop:228 length:216 start_codon:yes stop_codon:yes gene_type:complete
MRTTRTTTTKSDLEATVAELETRLENLTSTASNTTGKALGRLRWRITEVLELPTEARTTILAEIDTMIDNL